MLHRVLKRKDSGHFKGELRRIDLVEGAIGDPDDHINHGESSHDAVVGTFEDTFRRGLDEFFGDRSTNGLVDDLDAFALSAGSILMQT